MLHSLRDRLATVAVKALRPALDTHFDHRRMHVPQLLGDASRLHVADGAVMNSAILNTSSGTIEVGPHAFFGDDVMVLAGTHDATQRNHDRTWGIPQSGHDVIVEEGAWIASRAVLVGPCRIGAHAVVAAGAVVTGDVEPGTLVGGVPARPIKALELQDAAPPRG